MALFFTHIPFMVNHTINAMPPERLQQQHTLGLLKQQTSLLIELEFLSLRPEIFPQTAMWPFMLAVMDHPALAYSCWKATAEMSIGLDLDWTGSGLWRILLIWGWNRTVKCFKIWDQDWF